MAIKRGSKVNASFSAASMTDLMFLLLVFMLIATTLINPNALKLTLPTSNNQIKDKAYFKKYLQSSKKITMIGVNLTRKKASSSTGRSKTSCSRLPGRDGRICIVSKSNIPAVVDIKHALSETNGYSSP